MRAIQVSEHGGPEVLVVTDLPDPTVAPDQVLVDIEAIGINFIDTYVRTGLYPTDVPYVPGSEGTGVVTAVGSQVRDITVGDRIAWSAGPGSYAEKVAVPAAMAVPVPDGIEAPVAASVLLA